jgi:hypothetical protein
MNMLHRCLYCFSHRDKSDFLAFDDRWIFFTRAMDDEKLYFVASRIMQNIQDIEDSKKIGVIPDIIETHTALFDYFASELTKFDDDQSDDSHHGELNEDCIENDFDFILEVYEFHQDLLKVNVERSSCGTLLNKMKDSHIIQIRF